MRDYSNMPVLEWDGEIAAKKAMAQVHHAEPVILQMPKDYVLGIDAEACGCQPGETADRHVDCHAEDTLRFLANENKDASLAKLGEVAHEAGQTVDVLLDTWQIVIHD